MTPQPLLSVRAVTKHYPVGAGIFSARAVVRAVDDVSFDVHSGETLAIVGESGSGKSTVARMVSGLLSPTTGSVRFKGEEIAGLGNRGLKALRKRVQMVFQDPMASLNGRMKVGAILEEPLIIHGHGDHAQRRRRVDELLELVGLRSEHAARYPHQFSGGQKQRIGIARALAVEPELLVLDEPVSALDVSVQAQIINLLKDLQRQFGLSYVFIAHDLAVVRNISNRIAVMYLGKIVETGDREALFRSPAHPYTRMLVAAVPRVGLHADVPDRQIHGEIPSPVNPPSGCHFHPRCRFRIDQCAREVPVLTQVNDQYVSCLRARELPAFEGIGQLDHLTPQASLRMRRYTERMSRRG